MLERLKLLLRSRVRRFRTARRLNAPPDLGRMKQEIDVLYRLLYNASHDLSNPIPLATSQTEDAFAHQWKDLKEGRFLLSDPWFREHVTRILSEEEILIRPEWFEGKRVLDAGSGNGRWSYGLAKLGARVTAVDVNPVAIEETRAALMGVGDGHAFHVTPLEELDAVLGDERFDLVFSWGVLHHCADFSRALEQVTARTREGGVLYLYLYGRESLSLEEDIELFKERLAYNTLEGEEARLAFLLEKAHGDPDKVHNVHDIYAPSINRRLDYLPLEQRLTDLGFHGITRTIDHPELFVRAFRGSFPEDQQLPPSRPPFWFQRP